MSQAIEVVKDEKSEPYIFSILSPTGSDIEKTELKLKAKIKRGIDNRYLFNNDDDGYELNEKNGSIPVSQSNLIQLLGEI